MKKNSIEQASGNTTSLRFNILIALFCGLLILAHFISSFFPQSRFWGINHLAYFPLWIRLFFTFLGFLILVPLINAKVYKFLEQFLSVLQRIFVKRKVLGYTFLSAVFMFLFWLLRTRTHFLGDGYAVISHLQSEQYIRIGFEPASIFIHLYLYKFLKIFFNPSAESVYAGLSILTGGFFIFILFFLAKFFSEDRFERLIIFSIFLFSGATQLFLGYAEHYTLTYVSIFAYIYFCLRYLQVKVNIILPILFCILSIGFHFSSVYLLPSLFFLFILKKKKGEMVFSLKKTVPYLPILMSLTGFSIYYIWSFNPHILDIFVPLLKGRGYAPRYTLFSLSHLLDILNQHLLLSTSVVILLLCLGVVFRKVIRFKDPISLFLILVSMSMLFYHFLVDPKFGAVRDWDLFSSVGLGYIFLGIYLFINLVKSNRYSAMVIMFTAFLCTLPWFMLNSDTQKAIERFKNLLDLDLKRNFTGRNTLIFYLKQEGRFAEAAEVKAEIWRLFPEDTLIGTAKKRIASGDYEIASKLLREIIDMNPPINIEIGAYDELARIYLYQGKIDKALEFRQEIVRRFPHDYTLHYNLGDVLYRKDRLHEALEEYRKAAKLGGGAEVYTAIGFIHQRFGESAKAIKAYKQAVEINSEYFDAMYGLGSTYLQMNSLAQALLAFEKALSLKPDFAPIYYNLGMVYVRKGLKDKAIESLESFIKLSQDESMNEKVKGLIQQLISGG